MKSKVVVTFGGGKELTRDFEIPNFCTEFGCAIHNNPDCYEVCHSFFYNTKLLCGFLSNPINDDSENHQENTISDYEEFR